MKVAICTDMHEFKANRILDKPWAKKFPGALWVSFLADYLTSKRVEVVTGDIALVNIQFRGWSPKEVLVIQGLDAVHGKQLIKLGAKPFVLTGFESPLYAPYFYDQLPKIAPQFIHRILYSGAFKNFAIKKGFNHLVYFPSYIHNDIIPVKKWDGRKFIVMVISNKYFEVDFSKLPLFNPKRYLGPIKRQIIKFASPTMTIATKNELISKRLEAVEYFGDLGLLSLSGREWDSLGNLPLRWQKKLTKILKKLKPKPIEDKLKTISFYKFSICFENVSYPGYITEKIIDCFVAGVIPIYLGAPNIEKFIPRNSFIDMRNFDSWEKLYRYLAKIDSYKAAKMIKNGRNFLRSSKGKLYSQEEFANFVGKLVLTNTLII